MQAGFALLTCGLVRKKNAGHLMMLNFAAYVFAFLAYYVCGFAFQYGAVAINAAPVNLGGTPTLNQFLIGDGHWGFLGGKGFFLSGAGYDAGANVLVLFEVVFMETAGYIIVGAICERITFGAFLLCELFMGAILYPIFGCWVWGGGWMSQLGTTLGLGHGYCDFAGSTVVHAVGGFAAMALAIILGPRIGKYGADGKPRAFPAHNIVFVVTGTFILLFGWMGFNPGSTLGATDLRISVIAINTNLAAVRRRGLGDVGLVLHLRQARHLDGLQRHARRPGGDHGAVRVRRRQCGRRDRHPCGHDRLWRRALQRARAQGGRPLRRDLGPRLLRMVWRGGPRHLRRRHLRCGLERRRRHQLPRQGRPGRHRACSTATRASSSASSSARRCVRSWAFGATFVVFKIVNAVRSLRVSAEVELEGLDVPEFGLPAYPEDTIVAAEA